MSSHSHSHSPLTTHANNEKPTYSPPTPPNSHPPPPPQSPSGGLSRDLTRLQALFYQCLKEEEENQTNITISENNLKAGVKHIHRVESELIMEKQKSLRLETQIRFSRSELETSAADSTTADTSVDDLERKRLDVIVRDTQKYYAAQIAIIQDLTETSKITLDAKIEEKKRNDIIFSDIQAQKSVLLEKQRQVTGCMKDAELSDVREEAEIARLEVRIQALHTAVGEAMKDRKIAREELSVAEGALSDYQGQQWVE